MQIEWFEYLQIASFVIAVICRKALYRQGIVVFIPFLLLDCAADLLGDNYKTFGWKQNYFLYNYYLLLSTPLLFYLFYKMLGLQAKSKAAFFIITILCLSLILLNYFFIQGTFQFNTYSLLLIMILNIILSCLVLVKLAVDDNKLQSLYKEPFFWINAGTLLFSLGTLVSLGLQQYIAANNITWKGEKLYNVIMPVLNAFLYVALSYGFILCRIQQIEKYSS